MYRIMLAIAVLLLPTALFARPVAPAATDGKAPAASLATTGDAEAAAIRSEAMAIHKGKEPTFIVRGDDPVTNEDTAAERGAETGDEIDADFDQAQ